MKVNPAYTSKVCGKCGKEGELGGLKFICSCGVYDRDYNASLNIAKRALRMTKSRAYEVRDNPGSIPSHLVGMEGKAVIGLISLSKLFAWLSVIQASYIKLQKLLKLINSDKYG